MANELRHGSVGTELTQAEWEAVGAHVFNSQATGDIVYASSSSQLSRLAKGTDTHVLILSSGIPAWSSSTGITALGTIATGVWQGTDVGVAYGGTGVSTLLTNAVLTGNGASAIQAETTLLFSSNKLIPTASAHDAAGTVLSMSAGATTAGTTNNIAGGALTLQGGQGKGSGAGGDIIFQTANAGGSGSSLNALATALTLSDDLSATFAGDVNFGADGTNQDVNFYGDTSGRDMSWDAGSNALLIKDNAGLYLGDGTDLQLWHGSDVSYIRGINYPLQIDLNNGDLLNVAASGNDWDSTSLRSGLIQTTVTGANTQVGLSVFNKQTKANGVGPMMTFGGHTSGQSMGYIWTIWDEEDAAADSTTMYFANRKATGGGGSLDARLKIHGAGHVDVLQGNLKVTAGDIDLNSTGDLLNVGASGNDWTTNDIKLSSARAGGSNQILVYNTDTTANSSAILRLETDATDNGGVDPYIDFHITGVVGWQLGVDNSESDRFALSTTGFASNDAFRVSLATPPVMTYNTSHPTGTFDYVCESCGQHQAELFSCCGSVDWHDDVLDFRAMALRDPDALNYMERVGVIEQGFNTDGDPEIFTVLGRDFEFAMSAAFQNRQRMDAQNEAMDARLKRIEQALGV